jgi:hypothetical protein
MGMDETQMILALQALRALLDKGDRDDCDELVALYRARRRRGHYVDPMACSVPLPVGEVSRQPSGRD